ncbi:hypothetical protein [Enemella evansiae]|uniref:Uncharacterized protein n=1 Tax=Enemella evansiae TaxID=2016499 RepID=A0A255GMQ3_9ACTN|nr:hypothetical protein [Enemella evansiae]PFG67415.1 hypothetical protein B0O41_2231 [Propionibacteriaceae bacterium ES.041]OYN99061.1 hypothetical protein CGZ96_07360 [Enemella evansiae]OYO01391.1 hypothetical protein CGZ97_18455 [Enemella evansiae]OYO07367.1 hypothetical protein CGZ98_18005 [Enemella evansiae]OYO14274.1 hypothetical protein CGZ94_06495 [Enemella evansiae]
MSRPTESSVRGRPKSYLRLAGVVLWVLLAIAAFFVNQLLAIGLLVMLLGMVHRSLRIPLLVLGVVCVMGGVLMLVGVFGGAPA